jgi:2,5-dioxopentanoate dehydrogenase
MNLSGKNIIGYSLSSTGEKSFHAFNPADGSPSPTPFFRASPDEINRAFELADQAAPVLSVLPANRIALFLAKIAENIMLAGDILLTTATFETGLPESRIMGERGRTISQIKMFVDLIRDGSWVEASIDTGIPERQPVPKPDIRRMLIPIGPVIVFGAGNFPLAFSVAGGDTISALASGNPVIVKAHPAHPGTSELVGQCILDAARATGMPDGTFSLLFDEGFTVGQALVSHPSARAVGFTGSFQGGKSLFDLAMKRPEPIPVFAEMGSVNPMFILPDALRDNPGVIASKIAGSVTLGAGQFCTNPGLIIVLNNSDTRSFLTSMADAIKEAVPQTMLTAAIAERYRADVDNLVTAGMIDLLAGATLQPAINQGPPIIATVTGTQFENNPKLAEEIFGPYSLIVLCDTPDQMLRIAGNLDGQLTISLFYHDNEELARYQGLTGIIRTKAGRIVFNGVPTGVEVCHSMHHGGPFPASTDSRFTSVGTSAIKRWARPVAFQDCPEELLPPALKSGNPLKIWRLINGKNTNE